MSLASVTAFWAIAALFAITPGADWAYAIAAGLHHRSPVPAVAGMLSGHLLATVVVAAGVGALVASAPVALTLLTLAGAAYLVWLGVGLLRAPVAAPQALVLEGPQPSWISRAGRGLGVSGLNPKVFLLFLALLPQFTDPTAAFPVGLQMLLLGLVHVGNCAVVYLLVGFGARRVLRTRPTAARIVTRVSGVAMILIALVLTIEKVLPR